MDDEAEKWEYNETDQIWERRIMKFNHIYDVSPVTRPAYSDTEAVVGARSLEKVKSRLSPRRSDRQCKP
jgi:phage head maturation protease